MSCLSIMPNGAGRDACILDQPTNLFIFKTGVKFNNYVDASNLEKWRVLIQESLTVYPTLPMRNVASTKPSVRTETDGAGVDIDTGINAGGVVINLKTSSCDFKEILKAMSGGFYGIGIGLGSNKVMLLENHKGELSGFNAQCTAIPFGMPTNDAKIEEFQLKLNWQNVDDFKNYRIIEMPVMLNEITELTPLGIDVQVKTALASTAMAVKITERCMGVGVTETLTFVVTDSNVSDANVVPTATSNGEFTLVVTKEATPVALIAGDYIKGYYVKMDTLIHELISGEVIITA